MKESTGKQAEITSVVIACCKTDFHLARLCAASVRYRYPKIAILLVKDLTRGPFSTAELERHWSVGILQTESSIYGWGFAKLAAIFALQGERALVLDADTVLIGDVLRVLEQHGDPEVALGYDWDKLHTFDPGFAYPGLCFNSGQFVANGGALTKADFQDAIAWTSPPAVKRPDVFFAGEQGAFNYVAAKRAQLGVISLRSVDFGRWIGDARVAGFALEAITAGGLPFVLHWAGPKPSSIRRMQRPDILEFFESFYYSRIPWPGLARRWFAVRHTVASVPEDARKRLRKVEKWLRAQAKKVLRGGARKVASC